MCDDVQTEEVKKIAKDNPLKIRYIKTVDGLDLVSFTMPEGKKNILLINPVSFVFYEEDDETQLHMEYYLPNQAFSRDDVVVERSKFTIISEEADSDIFDIDFIQEYLNFIGFFDDVDSEEDEMSGNVISFDKDKPTIH